MTKRTLNTDPLPLLAKEGFFYKNLPIDIKPRTARPRLTASGKLPHWTEGLTPWQRLFSHHTLCSVRHARLLHRPHVPVDSLDLALASTYHHDAEIFPDKCDVILQPETVGLETWRVLRNVKTVHLPKPVARGHPINYGGPTLSDVADNAIDKARGGMTRASEAEENSGCHVVNGERKSIYSVKLGIAADHTAQTNAGFSRKIDGTFYAV